MTSSTNSHSVMEFLKIEIVCFIYPVEYNLFQKYYEGTELTAK